MENNYEIQEIKRGLLHLLLILLIGLFSLNPANAQDQKIEVQDTLTISSVVGNVIDSVEKIRHRIMPYYSRKEFINAAFIRTADSSIVVKANLKPDRIEKRSISNEEYLMIKNIIEGKKINKVYFEYANKNSLPHNKNSLPQNRYAQISKNKKTVGWLMLGAGVTLTGLGLYANAVEKPLLLFFNLISGGPTIKSDPTITAITVLGVGTALGSIPFFISSGENARKAATISLNNQKILFPQQNTFILETQPTLTLKISL